MFGRKPYNYESFSNHELLRDAARHGFGSGPEPGERAPDFELRSIEGDKFRLSDFAGEKNVVLTFGSATCPFTASSIRRMNNLYEEYQDNDDVEFLFVYIREAHPGEKLPAHQSMDDKLEAAETLRDEEHIEFTILLDELDGKVHKKYGKMPNPTYIIDKSGRVAFRSLWSRVTGIGEALEELLEVQEERDTDHAVVNGGEDLTIPMTSAMITSHRALGRGGKKAIQDFREGLGRPGRMVHSTARVVGPVVLNPGAALTAAGLAAGVIAGGLYVGYRLRKARFARSMEPYHYGYRGTSEPNDEYAVGI
ncbi:MAG TPA: deiodinase-like protein [Terriglobales bacterium]|nr:deiodinase-like protein [Terriglobales bacterium]